MPEGAKPVAKNCSSSAALRWPGVISRPVKSLFGQRAEEGKFAASIGHEDVWRTLQNVKLQMDRVRYLSLPDTTPEELLIEQHHTIVQALEAQNPDRAEVAVRQHLAEVLRSLPLLVRNFSDYFEGSSLQNS